MLTKEYKEGKKQFARVNAELNKLGFVYFCSDDRCKGHMYTKAKLKDKRTITTTATCTKPPMVDGH